MERITTCSPLPIATPLAWTARFFLWTTFRVEAMYSAEAITGLPSRAWGYTKEDEDALGSRGQGKAAFLYHSHLPPSASFCQDRMMILYDTLLADGTYRLGVRYANPSDTVQSPPLSEDQARSTVSTRFTSTDGTEIELSLGSSDLRGNPHHCAVSIPGGGGGHPFW